MPAAPAWGRSRLRPAAWRCRRRRRAARRRRASDEAEGVIDRVKGVERHCRARVAAAVGCAASHVGARCFRRGPRLANVHGCRHPRGGEALQTGPFREIAAKKCPAASPAPSSSMPPGTPCWRGAWAMSATGSMLPMALAASACLMLTVPLVRHFSRGSAARRDACRSAPTSGAAPDDRAERRFRFGAGGGSHASPLLQPQRSENEHQRTDADRPFPRPRQRRARLPVDLRTAATAATTSTS